MTDLICRKKSNKQFNRYSLNAQDKINCNNINHIREERIANSIYTGSATSHAYVQSFTTSEPPRDPFPLCSEKLTNQETMSLDHNNNFLFEVQQFFSLLEKNDTN